MEFVNLQDIIPENHDTWKGKSVLTFDIDWASDEVINDTIDIVENVGVRATFFITHKTRVLDRLRGNANISLGLHPNFNPYLKMDDGAICPHNTFTQIRKLGPEAKVLRSHSMTHSALWLDTYKKLGITHLSQYYMGGIDSIQPFRHINGIVEAPVYFADDGYLYMESHKKLNNLDIDEIIKNPQSYLKVYNFHPIHIALNSHQLEDYESTKLHHQDWELVLDLRNRSFGMRDLLKNLISN